MRIWPDTLPGAIEPEYRLSPVDQSIRTNMEVGTDRVRRISAARRDSLQLSWKFTDTEMAAFRAFWGDEPWSLAGASDSLASWALTGVTVSTAAAVSPDGLLVDRLVDTATTGSHIATRDLGAGALAGRTLLCRVTVRAAGITWFRLGFRTRAGTFAKCDVNLATGAFGSQSGLLTRRIENRGGGWWRITITVDVGTGATEPNMRLALLGADDTPTYTGTGTGGVDICELGARLTTGHDLHLRTGADGRALGVAGGSAWVSMMLAFGGGLRLAEARFEGPFEAALLPALGWLVSGRLEVRNA